MLKKKLFAILLIVTLNLGTVISVKAETVTSLTSPTVNYTVKSGDTLWNISTQYKTTVNAIMQLNGLTSSNIFPGQVLKVEDKTLLVYTIISGDTLWSISKKFNTTVDSIMKLNNLSSSTIYIGQALKITASITTPIATPVAPVTQTINYKVVIGDNLWTIATKYNTTMDAISKSNMLTTTVLVPGQILTVPVNSSNIVTPVGINKYISRVNDSYGDVYTWENAMRLWTVGTIGTVKDLSTGKTFNVKYYGGSNHSDVVTLTQADTDIMKSIYGTWSWSNIRPIVLYFEKGGTKYQLAASLTGMPHEGTDIFNNGMIGHTDMYFYNSTSHNTNQISQVHQANVLKASGR
jgi:LysM repeat protein